MTEHANISPEGVKPAPSIPPRPCEPTKSYRRHDGIGVGVALIVIGAVFIAARFMPGVYWWNLWPVFVVVGGLVHVVTPGPFERWGVHRLTEGAWVALIGGVLLGNTTSYVSWNVWWLLLSLWPVLLVAAGLKLLGRGLQQSWLRAVAGLVLVGALLFAIAASLTGSTGLIPASWNVPVREWSGKHVDIRIGNGEQPISVNTY